MTPENLESADSQRREIAFEVPLYSEKSGTLICKTWESPNRFRATVWTDSTGAPRLEVRGRCGAARPKPQRVKTPRGMRTEWPWPPCCAELCWHGVIWEVQLYGEARLIVSRAESYDAALLEARRLMGLHCLEEVEAWS